MAMRTGDGQRWRGGGGARDSTLEIFVGNPASEKMAKGGLDIGCVGVVDGVYAERRLILGVTFHLLCYARASVCSGILSALMRFSLAHNGCKFE